MRSLENRVILGSFLLFAAVIVGVIAAERVFDVRFGDYPLLAFLAFAGLTVALPQLYLAKTDTDVDPRSRVRFAVIVTMVFAAMFAESATTLQDRLILIVGGGAFLALVGYEFFAGYRASSRDGSRPDTDR
ncbi:hypothetical protein GS429_06610 [Natronorubrum sp. JWXQ-INN-674]|uniref:Uncharacterized protein n=1 Tax=Natronorubrum halalkaliphilum TaxID=2691917 RepID=A0A6B0VIR2_9EURY|nr:hypothetical protein [Natronorubrum halalkaliphilum]MXV61741.1 hypothetical protein [Natronorubrum halalkaliphilum]